MAEAGEPSIFALGLQEIVDLSAGTVVMDGFNPTVSNDAALAWASALTAALATFSCAHSHTYGLVARHHMVGVQLLVFARDTALPMIRAVQCGQVPCGNMGLGNKGGVMIRMDVMDTSVCFVSSHFAAHRGKVKARNRDYKTIANRHCFVDLAMEKFRKTMAASHRARNKVRKRDRIKGIVRKEQRDVVDKHSDSMKEEDGFSDGFSEDEDEYNEDMDLFGRTESLDARAMEAGEKGETRGDEGDAALGKLCALDHDLVFWMGDLNYRMDTTVPDEEVFELLRVIAAERESMEAGNVEEAAEMLLGYDQLNIERRNNRVFHGFHEGRTNFLPTYKYIPGDASTGWYDRRPDKKMRCPAWCDRVLWRRKHSNHHEDVSLLQYRRVDFLYASDHKPVNALFEVKVKSIDEGEKRRLLERVVGEARRTVGGGHCEIKVEGCFSFGGAFRAGKGRGEWDEVLGGHRKNHGKIGRVVSEGMKEIGEGMKEFGRRRSGISKGAPGTINGDEDADFITLVNTGEGEARYKIEGVPEWLELCGEGEGEGDDTEGVLGGGGRRKIWGDVKVGYEAKEGGRYMDVVTVKVEGGTDKCVGAVNWKLRWEAREIKEKGKQGGDDEKMKKLLGLR
ncbi:hypothetical protein TrRE_jg1166 [Triparma retinervis]|uniref:Inositol polyphosphate-related phosphatase domain-containing protein n=1 Tax=Triparma retinervis TaxID=2557542 RepID=A0A9W7FCT2_9STRA|nr:hypothetical protein TrRE_jg1166 [Triparma retinervis]